MTDHLQVQQQKLELPPGFRFHPTDEEIIKFYVVPKVLDEAFVAAAIEDVNLNKYEPWELPEKAKMGEKEWYFYCRKDRKYPTGIRTNQAKNAGYWKATGKDKEIFHPPLTLIGMKKTLVFYKGRAPRGEKTNWIMHEYRLESNKQLTSNPSTATRTVTITNASSNDGKVDRGQMLESRPRGVTVSPFPEEQWVVCRIFHKSAGLKKVVMPSYVMPMSIGAEHQQGFADLDTLPPLMGYEMSSSLANPMLLPTTSPYQLRDIGAGSSIMGSMFYQQHQQMMMYVGADRGFMVGAEPGCGPSSMVSQEHVVTGLSNNYQGNAAATAVGKTSSMNMGMDDMWKY
ncbi:unnamed protein product [Triticum turgidum subsp. durum]|uniref:NAC domain-containing protein n=1 Tax=Triticum turgidum subsp. durum TaxID=4567 RepID=A0A9R1BV02_TRITD|nr:unnamed protein product [Triticum turgidum subsp. durum]